MPKNKYLKINMLHIYPFLFLKYFVFFIEIYCKTAYY